MLSKMQFKNSNLHLFSTQYHFLKRTEKGVTFNWSSICTTDMKTYPISADFLYLWRPSDVSIRFQNQYHTAYLHDIGDKLNILWFILSDTFYTFVHSSCCCSIYQPIKLLFFNKFNLHLCTSMYIYFLLISNAYFSWIS